MHDRGQHRLTYVNPFLRSFAAIGTGEYRTEARTLALVVVPAMQLAQI
jgi:hypothetical protein